MVTRDEIFQTFWPNLTVKEATNVFHVTKRKINEVLGIDLTKYWSGFYHVSPDLRLSYDAARFKELVQAAELASQEERIPLLNRAGILYRGSYLAGMKMDWIDERRHDLAQLDGDALSSLARIYENAGDVDRSLGLYTQAYFANRGREDIVERVMDIYRRRGLQRDAIHVYESLTDDLGYLVGVTPAPHLQTLAAEIRAELGGASPAM